MSKIILDLTPQQITDAVDQLPNEAKIKLARRLRNFTAQSRAGEVLRRIDARKGKRPSTRDILQEIHFHRREKHAQSRD